MDGNNLERLNAERARMAREYAEQEAAYKAEQEALSRAFWRLGLIVNALAFAAVALLAVVASARVGGFIGVAIIGVACVATAYLTTPREGTY
jgi:1,4-dihydroxy-2-naphthoate octaprenyltransferase